jgi:hypothetical protein
MVLLNLVEGKCRSSSQSAGRNGPILVSIDVCLIVRIFSFLDKGDGDVA